MSSTLQPALTSLSPMMHVANSDDNKTNPFNCCATWHSSIPQPKDAYPSPHSQELVLQEPSMDVLCLPPFWETTHDSDLTVHLISAQRSEHWAECVLVHKRLECIKIEHELYTHMDQLTAQKLHKADTGVGVSRGVLRVSGLAGMAFDSVDSDALSVLHDSDVELS
ncbi:hypothetical protein BDR06DRAFT_1003572 [Suillus hirtellus]|nr:hypothetical protein BDR06DRAFT_1003572 [Suillus hirtellus]